MPGVREVQLALYPVGIAGGRTKFTLRQPSPPPPSSFDSALNRLSEKKREFILALAKKIEAVVDLNDPSPFLRLSTRSPKDIARAEATLSLGQDLGLGCVSQLSRSFRIYDVSTVWIIKGPSLGECNRLSTSRCLAIPRCSSTARIQVGGISASLIV